MLLWKNLSAKDETLTIKFKKEEFYSSSFFTPFILTGISLFTSYYQVDL